jgi:hypothetical protein
MNTMGAENVKTKEFTNEMNGIKNVNDKYILARG